MESDDRSEAILNGVSTVGQHAMSIGAKTIVHAATGSSVLGDAACVVTNHVIAKSDPALKSAATGLGLLGAASAAKVIILTGGVALLPAAAVVAGAAAVGGAVGFAIFAPLFYFFRDES